MPGGAPEGNNNAEKGTRWRNAIDKALENRCKSDGQKALVAIAEAMLAKAAEGDMTAIKELGDRIDGKVAQTSILEGGAKPVGIEAVARHIVDPKHTDS
jgi:hypothetical protein